MSGEEREVRVSPQYSLEGRRSKGRTLCDQLGGKGAANAGAKALANDSYLARIAAVASDDPVPSGPGVEQEASLGRRAG